MDPFEKKQQGAEMVFSSQLLTTGASAELTKQSDPHKYTDLQ